MRKLIASLALFAGVAMALPATSHAQQGEAVETFTCESQNNSHNECRYRSGGTVTVHVNRQLSHTRCVFNENWGTYDGGVWVDDGCRAEFVVRRPPSNPAYRPVGGQHQTITCESMNNRPAQCEVRGIDPRSVHLERKLSSSACIEGRTWGVSDGEASPPGIWVTNGCRATFSYRTGGGSFNAYGGTPYDYEMTCESLNGRWNHCEVQQVHMARIEVIRGNDACREYKAIGVDDTGVWVRNNCRAEVRIRYRH